MRCDPDMDKPDVCGNKGEDGGGNANQFALAPPGQYAEGRQTMARQVWQHIVPSTICSSGACRTCNTYDQATSCAPEL